MAETILDIFIYIIMNLCNSLRVAVSICDKLLKYNFNKKYKKIFLKKRRLRDIIIIIYTVAGFEQFFGRREPNIIQ